MCPNILKDFVENIYVARVCKINAEWITFRAGLILMGQFFITFVNEYTKCQMQNI
jgi:hypothetical protein